MPPRCKPIVWKSVEKDVSIYDKIQYGIIKIKCRSPMEHRFWSNVTKDGPVHLIHGQCWIWCAHRDRKGYGVYGSKKLGKILVHRYSYRLHNGEFEDKWHVLHKCDNPSCVNPDHLFLGTILDNIEDKMSKGRQVKGERQGSSKLTKADILDIRLSCKNGESWNSLARRYGLNRRYVGKIVGGYVWRHLEE